MSDHPVSIQCLSEDRIGLALNFRWQGDRFGHEIGLVVEDRQFALLTSVEGDATDTWPVSPPLQQISREHVLGQAAVMGIGMAGVGHWSASFLLKPGPLPELICQLACLANGTPAQLGSKYAMSPDIAVVDSPGSCPDLRFFSQRIPHNVTPWLAGETDTVNHGRIELHGSHLAIQPSADTRGPKQPIQWNYRIFLTENNGV